MGQQQLLLLLISVVLVALATMGAFAILDHYYQKDEADGLLDRSLTIATHAVYWKAKNDPFAGGNQSYENLVPVGIETLALDAENIRGQYAITAATENTLQITGVSTRYPGIGVRVFVSDYEIDSSYVRFDGSLTLDLE
ncbi:MAG: hypothetical protein R3362_10950 [Rhodothermales bacterium]|nr:hypothetical protein [Rhodothermales bacterium]